MATMFYEPFKADKSGEMPPPDAIENILPEYKYIFYDPKHKQKEAAPKQPLKNSKPAAEQATTSGADDRGTQEEDSTNSNNGNNNNNNSKDSINNLDANQMALLDYQMKELENYRQAVHKMGKDILQLRDHIHDLEDDNSSLRRQINRYDEARKELLQTTAAELEAIDRNELIIRYMTLKQRVMLQSTELSECREKIQKLQKQVLQQSDKEKKYDEMHKAHMAQLQELQNMQEKIGKAKKLEQACIQQEKVIETMEKVLKNKKFSKTDVSKAMNEENERLHKELQQLRVSSNNEDDKLKLYEQLEKAESRIASLERALADSSRTWARERQALQTRLQEAQHGFTRNPGPSYSDLPSDIFYDPKSHRRFGSPKLAPLHR